MRYIWDGSKKPIRSTIQETIKLFDDVPIETVTFKTKDYESKEEEAIFKDALKSMPRNVVTIEDFDDFYERLIITATFRGFDLSEEDL